MKITKIKIENFRLLKNFSIDLEEIMSLVIGKNNTGKTSLLTVVNRFLNENGQFSFDDFNIGFKKELKTLIEGALPLKSDYKPIGIKLKLFIEYNESDDLTNISRVMMDLDPESNKIILGYEYILTYDSLESIKEKYSEFLITEASKKTENENYIIRGTYDFLKIYQADFFKSNRKSIEYNKTENQENDDVYIDLDSEKISTKEIINFKFISAKRSVTNNENNKTLSTQTSEIYKQTEKTDEQNEQIEKFKDELISTDYTLSIIYRSLFEGVVEKVRKFGGIRNDDSTITIESSLQHRELLSGNTTVMYKHNDTTLPEYNNGLGYMNLISMIFEIEIKIQEFKKSKLERPSDINLFFIEEPEAHTHPQMQYVFIKNIKSILNQGIVREDEDNRKLQTVITTHSSHIVAESNFDDVKYLKKEGENNVISKNLIDLKIQYQEDPKQYQFLKQYLTLNRAEIFFADKAILIEGDTERILFPTLMKKIDFEEKRRYEVLGQDDLKLPLCSQNISVIEVGAYSQIFEKFIEFVGIKSLIITDLDAVGADSKKCRVAEGTNYSNDALRLFFNDATLNQLKSFTIDNKKVVKNGEIWQSDTDGNLCVVYQTMENGVNARSFEDAFIQINREFINDNKEEFKGLKNRPYFDIAENDSYKLAEECVNKKTHFALDILFHTDENFTNWQIPQYIKEGLLWLKQ
ncbi:putative ATP-dependent endonuclease of OLD family [Tenacibaculum gallaicum]|uniref:Putative ATP-dependent endonuclease of OLD family n=1 Tax=Tenacibaculum gallaicum TaxID=561505 RepID=A0A3E0I7V8_9FLAO|nr:ATP-dependent endonuclease [Tenacibaculum gallaicum]REH54729.1 putative ATP-dependent endonuclease of OLD family [Tenacibaculum gallaicum]